jgi:hypothetical protein
MSKKDAASGVTRNNFKNGAAIKMQSKHVSKYMPESNQKLKSSQKPKSKPNPFDLKVNKTKFEVLNRHVVGSKGKPTQAKTKSFEVRKRTLLPELDRRGRTGEFVDRRFGERNKLLTTEERMLERFSRERIKKSNKKSAFNLNDDVEDYSQTLTLTHRGKRLDDLDSLDSDPGVSDDDGGHGGLDAHLVKSGHFGGPNDVEKRTKAEIMQEVIAKSKMHKYERQRLKEENEALCQDLDQDFNAILGALQTRDSRLEQKPPAQADDYYESVRAMTFERRAKATDRTRTAEELEEEAVKKKQIAQEAKRKRMHNDSEQDSEEKDENSAEDEANEALTDHEKSIRQIMDQVRQHLDIMLSSSSLVDANVAYVELAKLSRTNSVIPVARVVRERLGEIIETITRLMENGSAPTMPNDETLILFHFIGRIFSTSDYHHIVVTPAELLISTYLHHGRLCRRQHIISALFLIQSLLVYQKDSNHICPEIFALLAPLLGKVFALPTNKYSSFPSDRFMSRSVHEFLTGNPVTTVEVRAISHKDLVMVSEDEEYLSKEMVASFLIHLVQEATHIYQDSVAAPELLLPLLTGLGSNPITESIIKPLESMIIEKQKKRIPLFLQQFKAISIPQLTPDLDDGPSREERQKCMLQRTYRRELKGAKRELRRDGAFLAQQKLQMRMENDRKYQERIRQIVGTISNEASQPKRRRK